MLQQENGREEARGEILRLAARTLGAPDERMTVEEESGDVSGRLLMSIKHLEGPAENHVVKARLVALGNVLLTKARSSVERLQWLGCVGPCVHDDNSEVCRSTSCQPPTVADSDLMQAYGQVSQAIFHFSSTHRKKLWNSSVSPTVHGTSSTCPRFLFPVDMGLYGIKRCGSDLINGLEGVLSMTHWVSVPTEPAPWT